MLMDHLKSIPSAIQMDGMGWRLHTFATEMRTHLDQEEVVMFPTCIDLEKQGSGKALPPDPLAVMRAIHAFTSGHGSAIESLADLITLSGALTGDGSHAVASLQTILQELDQDLREHGRLEEQFLLPAVLLLQEQSLKHSSAKTSRHSSMSRGLDQHAEDAT